MSGARKREEMREEGMRGRGSEGEDEREGRH